MTNQSGATRPNNETPIVRPLAPFKNRIDDEIDNLELMCNSTRTKIATLTAPGENHMENQCE